MLSNVLLKSRVPVAVLVAAQLLGSCATVHRYPRHHRHRHHPHRVVIVAELKNAMPESRDCVELESCLAMNGIGVYGNVE